MPLPYTGKNGELNFEKDFIENLLKAGWQEILKNKTVPELIENWRNIIFERNRAALNGVPLSENEMDAVLDAVNSQANTPVKANHFINGRPIAIKRDSDSKDTIHAGKEVYLDLFSAQEIAGGTSRYQIAEQTIFDTSDQYNDRRGDITLLINGMPVIHIELKASGIDVSEASNQILKYSQEGIFRGFMGLVQIFWAITPEDAIFFANAGKYDRFNQAFFFRWGDRDNNVIKNWKDLILSESHILSIPEAHKLIGYYCVADTAKDTLKVCRSYQYYAIRAIVKRTAEQRWGDHNQKGGFIWCTTGGGKTMTSFKAGQMIIDLGMADKVVFVVDRRVLDSQSAMEYNSFSRIGEKITETSSSNHLFNKLGSSDSKDSMILTSIQKISRIHDDADKLREKDLEKIKNKRIVFIIDEAHRSQFGTMHERVKNTFYNALFFGFTGTPIFSENMREGELTTETVFGPCRSVYSLATGIRDGNVLGFWPESVKTFEDSDLKEAVALDKCKAKKKEDIQPGTENWKIYKKYVNYAYMATEYDDFGNVKYDSKGDPIKGIEDLLPALQYDQKEHREKVVENILTNFNTIAFGEHGSLFHGILATSSIPEACKYWELFQEKAPELNVTALFDPNINTNTTSVFEKEKALEKIVDDYNKRFQTTYDRKTDPNYEGFREDLTNRLAHKETHKHIGNDRKQCVDLVIVVDQLLTGFDSQRINVLYLDKVLEADNLIQAISRTNRVYDNNEKPWGMVKFFRKTYTMRRNLKEALRLYCQGDIADVQVVDLPENIRILNETYKAIKSIFEKEKIQNFEQLPKSDESRQKFRKEFFKLKSTLRAAMLQGFKWSNQYGAQVDFDEKIYRVLRMRYEDLPSNRGGGGKGNAKPGYIIPASLSVMEMEKIDADYLEAQFKIVTMKDIEQADGRPDARRQAMEEIRKNLGMLSEIQQKYAKQVLEDIENGTLIVEPDKLFMSYIQEYMEKAQYKAIMEYAANTGLDTILFYEIYKDSVKNVPDSLKLEKLEKTADADKLKAYYNSSLLKARIQLHSDLKMYFEERKAD